MVPPSASWATHSRQTREKPRSPIRPVRFALLPAPWGELGIAGTSKGLMRIDFHPSSIREFKNKMGLLLKENPVEDPGFFKDFATKLRQYFSGAAVAFDDPVLLDGFSPFQRKVLTALRSVPFGRSLSYSGLGLRAGAPGAARAVGGACGRNPLPLVIPCHRILRSDGRLGGFSGGLEIKRHLLRIEKLAFRENPGTPL